MNAVRMSLALSNPQVLLNTTMPEQRFGTPHSLVAGLLAGSQDAAVALFDQYSGLVQRSMFSVLGPDPELSDAVQEAFMSALRTLPKLRDPQALPHWMKRVAIHTAVDWVRRRERRCWLSVVDPDELNGAIDNSEEAPEREALGATYELLKALPTQERTVFSLRYIEGLELKEIAEACDFSVATVKRRLASASQRFRALAKNDPVLGRFVSEAKEGT
jgi:RNA polymerase sigma-70 factor (ECF subfamily)